MIQRWSRKPGRWLYFAPGHVCCSIQTNLTASDEDNCSIDGAGWWKERLYELYFAPGFVTSSYSSFAEKVEKAKLVERPYVPYFALDPVAFRATQHRTKTKR